MASDLRLCAPESAYTPAGFAAPRIPRVSRGMRASGYASLSRWAKGVRPPPVTPVAGLNGAYIGSDRPHPDERDAGGTRTALFSGRPGSRR
jgi:hypothetical protein